MSKKRMLKRESVATYLTIDEFLNRSEPLFAIYTDPDVLVVLVFLHGEHDRWYVKITENGVD